MGRAFVGERARSRANSKKHVLVHANSSERLSEAGKGIGYTVKGGG